MKIKYTGTLLNKVAEILEVNLDNEDIAELKEEGNDFENLDHVIDIFNYRRDLSDDQKEMFNDILETESIIGTDEQLELLEAIYNADWDNDFYIECLSMEFRAIHDDIIDELWSESLEEQLKDCYDLSSIPDFIVVDWEQTVENCKVDGKGHHFATYDSEEHDTTNYTFFKTN